MSPPLHPPGQLAETAWCDPALVRSRNSGDVQGQKDPHNRGAASAAKSFIYGRDSALSEVLRNMSWNELPQDLLDQIVKRMDHHLDVIQFGLVSKSWSSVAVANHACVPKQLPLSFCSPQPRMNPLLMLPSKGGSEYCHFWSVTENKLTSQFSLPEARGKWPCSTSFGWILMIDFEEAEELVLYNPVTKAQIQLPPVSTFPKFPLCQDGEPVYDPPEYHFITKAILSVDPSKDPDNWILMAIVSYARRLCFCRAKDHKWTLVGSGPVDPPLEEIGMHDVIYSNERFYVVNMSANVYTVVVGSLGSMPPKFEVFAKSAHDYDATNYLVMSSEGELLLVAKFVEFFQVTGHPVTYHTDEVIAYKFDSNNNEWEELEHLGANVLLLGRNASLCLSREEVPELKTNCIYFADDKKVWNEDGTKLRCLDSGIYNYEDGSIQQLDEIGPYSYLPPLWIIASILR